ncbi:AraC-like DNA-binding protein [Nocardiopsis sp. Huas11]|uniref:helix-turn-helix domain-containing protein n=1 Tax=Nocardiopsis sp. Huas11 TaxID=2183912 RepID=UPI000F1EEEE3|nr:helix-turn-helix domain-containing protein [Nocardiopsis sp. Huas11]RKS05336.1 AraC-like DNA-binding protein [Nocardiopsis sp. Huas11]
MRRARAVHTGTHLTVHTVTCTDEHADWSRPEVATAVGIVLVRRGRFRLRGPDGEVALDRTVGYVEVPGRAYGFAHPAGGDECTAIAVGEDLWREAADGRPVPSVFAADGRLDTAHRLLLRADDAFTATEGLLWLLRRALRSERLLPVTAGPGRRSLADAAREAILADHPASRDLVGLARVLGVDPAHLSRTFRHHTGATVSAFRTRVRVARALDRLEDGADLLAEVAADLGFADQAHLTRAVRAQTGHTPAALRAVLSRAPRPVAGPGRVVPGGIAHAARWG